MEQEKYIELLKQALAGETAWQRMAAFHIGLDPEAHDPQSFMQLDLESEDR